LHTKKTNLCHGKSAGGVPFKPIGLESVNCADADNI